MHHCHHSRCRIEYRDRYNCLAVQLRPSIFIDAYFSYPDNTNNQH